MLPLLPDELVVAFAPLTQAGARRIVSGLIRYGDLPSSMLDVPKRLLETIKGCLVLPRLELVEERKSDRDGFVKYAFLTEDRQIIESVRIPLEKSGRMGICVSSQIGCRMGCAFCGTARMGFVRNLSTWEIVEQIRQVRQRLPADHRIHAVAFQGMGEPLANPRALVQALELISLPSGLAIDHRNVTVCTSGLAPSLRRLVRLPKPPRWALSIGSACPEKRARLIPLERRFALRESLAILAETARTSRVAPLFAYTLLLDVNDGASDLDALLGLVQGFSEGAGLVPRVTLVEYSPLGDLDPYRPSPMERLKEFRNGLGRHGIPVSRRYSGGADIKAACGQLGLSWLNRTVPSLGSAPAAPEPCSKQEPADEAWRG